MLQRPIEEINRGARVSRSPLTAHRLPLTAYPLTRLPAYQPTRLPAYSHSAGALSSSSNSTR